MHTKKRRFEPAVIERLFAEPQRFDYFQAVRMLELWLKRNGVPQESAVANVLRFQNSVSLGFPASQIEALQLDPPDLVLARDELKIIRITPAFMGMLGIAGSLPAHYPERIAAHQLATRDDGPRAFLDTFSNRALALFYAAWRKYRLELAHQPGARDGLLPLLLAVQANHQCHGSHAQLRGQPGQRLQFFFCACLQDVALQCQRSGGRVCQRHGRSRRCNRAARCTVWDKGSESIGMAS